MTFKPMFPRQSPQRVLSAGVIRAGVREDAMFRCTAPHTLRVEVRQGELVVELDGRVVARMNRQEFDRAVREEERHG